MRRILIFVLGLLIGSSIMIFYVRKTVYQNQAPKNTTSPQKSSFSLENAPSRSLKGTILTSLGDVKWESRTASSPSELTEDTTTIQQGEIIETSINAQLSVSFNDVATISAGQNTKIEFAQTLPDNIVINQSSGTVEYETSGLSPLSIRTLHLLTQQTKGDTIITIDEELPIITIQPITYSLQVGFNDTDNISTVLTIPAGKTLTFNDKTRIATIR